MNREIKFRVWDGEKFTYGINQYVLSLCGDILIGKTGESCNWWKLQQLTGLKDKNGQEIYEGDIIKFHVGRRYVPIKSVYWGVYYLDMYPTTGWCIDEEDDNLNCKLNADPQVLEVVGNIFENSELLNNP